MATNFHITRIVPRDPAEEYVHDKLFMTDRRYNGLTINPRTNNYVRTVTDEPLTGWDTVFESAAVSVLSGVPGVPGAALQGALVRSAMRGQGRPRWR